MPWTETTRRQYRRDALRYASDMTDAEWALIVVSSLVGAYYLTNLFTLSPTAQILVGSGLFIIGALTQLILKRSQGDENR